MLTTIAIALFLPGCSCSPTPDDDLAPAHRTAPVAIEDDDADSPDEDALQDEEDDLQDEEPEPVPEPEDDDGDDEFDGLEDDDDLD